MMVLVDFAAFGACSKVFDGGASSIKPSPSSSGSSSKAGPPVKSPDWITSAISLLIGDGAFTPTGAF